MKLKAVLFLIIIFFISGADVFATSGNAAADPGFESVAGEGSGSWSASAWDTRPGITLFESDQNEKHGGSKSVCIINSSPNDSRYKQSIAIEKDSYYRLSCWIRTEGVGLSNKGANLSAEGLTDTSADIRGTSGGWEYVELYGRSGVNQDSFVLTVGLGGYGSTNTGKAWFDDVAVEKVQAVPAGTRVINLYPEAVTNPEGGLKGGDPGGNSPGKQAGGYNSIMLFYTLVFAVLALFFYNLLKKRNKVLSVKQERLFLVCLLAAGLVLRLIVAPMIEGWPNDISANKYWALSAARNLAGFYGTVWCDYPPLYIYVLAVIGKLASIPGAASMFTMLVKLPSMLADLVTAYMIFRLFKKNISAGYGILAAAVYAFHPAVLLDSSIWGQSDSFFTMIIVAALMLLMEERFNYASVMFAAAVLMKPQGIFFLPLLLFALIRRRSAKAFWQALISGLATSVAIILPFSFTQQPLWIFKLYLNTANEYNFAAMNAFNLFGLLGANFKDASSTAFIFSCNTWGIIFDVLLLGLAGFIYLKGRHAASPALCALLLGAGAFVFSVKMHERYMYAAVAIALTALAYIRDKRLVAVFSGLSVIVFFNMHILFYRMLDFGVQGSFLPSNYPLLILFSLANVLLFFYLVKISIDIAIKGRTSPFAAGAADRLTNRQAIGAQSLLGAQQVAAVQPIAAAKDKKPNAAHEQQADSYGTAKRTGLDRKDILIMAIMTAVYAIIALIGLGSLRVPQTSWTPSSTGESFVIDLGRAAELSRLYYYNGMGQGRYSVEYLDKTGAFVPFASIDKTSIFIWQYINMPDVKISKIKIITEVPGAALNEVGVFEKGGIKPLGGLKIVEKSVNAGDSGAVENLIDEQDRIDYNHTFMSGMIFDEIYHARTAYEYLHHLEPFEWTHPPLGKILISLGLVIFGMDPFGWRIIGTLFGIAMVPLMYLFGRKLFSRRFYGFCAAFLMMFDFMHYSQSRIATIDVYGTFFVILMYFFMYDYFVHKSYALGYRRSLTALFLCGLCFGLGAASKWIGLYAGGGLAVLFFLTKYSEYWDYKSAMNGAKAKRPKWVEKFMPLHMRSTFLFCILFFVMIPAIIYAMSYIPYLMVPGPGHGIDVILRNQADMFNYHSKGVLGQTHPFSSRWWQWPLMSRPLLTYRGSDLAAGMSSSMVIMGNPAIWWTGIVTVLAALCIAFKKRDRKMTVVFVAMAFQYLPWIPIERLTFIYHFFSTVPFMILTTVYIIKTAMEKYPRAKYWVYAYLVVTAALFIMFYPVLSGMEVPRSYVDHFLLWFRHNWVF